MKRLTWFVVGAASGIGSARLAKKKVQQTVDRLSPDHVARQSVIRLKHVGQDIADAIRDGRGAMVAKEAELRARRDGHAVTIPNAIDTTEVSHLDDWRHRRTR
jgi:demethoxyubiquinone hydroxylase (CLK1/Coq7/Cat5 family)